MFADLKFIVFWWLIIFFLSSLSLPLIFSLFRKFWDRGYLFAKITSLSLLTYLIFVLGVFKFLPFTNSSIFILILLFLLVNLYHLSRANNFTQLKNLVSQKYKIFIFEEVLFFFILAFWSYVRGFQPQIEGLEKFMDWGFLNSALRTKFLPPGDMWFSGHPINYYYFGHLIFALLTKISGIDSAITYNLSIATVCALTFVSVFSLSSNLVFFVKNKAKTFILAGLISALLATFGGNLHPVYKIAKIKLSQNISLTQAAASYWYPDATRFIGFDPDVDDKTIHEFPCYSFVVADLHGHMNNIPQVLFFVAFLLTVFTAGRRLLAPAFFIPAGFILSLIFMTNAWDFATYGLLFALSALLINLSFQSLKKTLLSVIPAGFLIILFWYVFTLPFYLNFDAMVEGVKLADSHSPLYQLFILHGGFWLFNLPFLLVFFFGFLFNRKIKTNPADLFVLSLILLSLLLVIIPEIIYLKDIYIYEHRRANTMFKLVYQAFILSSLTAGFVLARLKTLLRPGFFRLYQIIFLLVFISHMIYPFFAVRSYYSLRRYQGLWGLGFLKQQYPDNFKAISWINQNISGQPVMLEAVGDSYTTFNQVSTATGLPTVQGWLVHEWLWRGGFDQPGSRQADVDQIYQSSDPVLVRSLVQKYSVNYIFVGDKEREKYPHLNEEIFQQLNFPVVAEFGQTRIYKIP